MPRRALFSNPSRPLITDYMESKWCDIWIRDVFWPQHLGYWGQNTSKCKRHLYLSLLFCTRPCSTCGPIILTPCPYGPIRPVLNLQLRRFEYDMMRDESYKVSDRFEFPANINLDEFLDKPEATPADYTLHSVSDRLIGPFVRLIRPFDRLVGPCDRPVDTLAGRCDRLIGPVDTLAGRCDRLIGPFDRLVGLFDRLEGPCDGLIGPFDRLEGPCGGLVGLW